MYGCGHTFLNSCKSAFDLWLPMTSSQFTKKHHTPKKGGATATFFVIPSPTSEHVGWIDRYISTSLYNQKFFKTFVLAYMVKD